MAEKDANRHVKNMKCYLTKACISVMGLPDDCDAMVAMSKLKETYVKKLPDGKEILGRYEKVVPKIVSAIENSGKYANEQLEFIYKIILIPCSDLASNGCYFEAYTLYSKFIEKVAEMYNVK